MTAKALFIIGLLYGCVSLAQPSGFGVGGAPGAGLKDRAVDRILPKGSTIPGGECSGQQIKTKHGSSLSISRPSSAYCTKSDGSMVLLSSNQPRVALIGGVPMLHIEAGSTNNALWSSALDNVAAWSLQASTTSPTITANVANVPWVGTIAERVDFPAVSGAGSYSLIRQTFTTVTGGTNTASIYMKSVTTPCSFYIANAKSTTEPSTLCTSTSNWTRCSVPFSGAVTTYFDIGTNLNNTNQSSTVACSVYLAGAQVEPLPVVTSLIETTSAAASRNADVISVTTPANVTSSAGCGAANVYVPAGIPTGTNARVLAFNGAAAPVYFYDSTTAGSFDGANGTGSVGATQNVSTAAHDFVGFWSGSTLGTLETATGLTFTGPYNSAMVGPTLYIGVGGTGTSGWLNGYVGNIRLGNGIGKCNK